MSTWMPVPAALPPLVGCALALCALWLGWRTLRTRTLHPLIRPLFRLNARWMASFLGAEAAQRVEAEPLAPGAARLYGWAWIYAGTLGALISGGQLVRLITGMIG